MFSLKKKVIVFSALFSLLTPLNSLSKEVERSYMYGEVEISHAYVQSQDIISNAFIRARIKILTAGTYTVIGGYSKGNCWHEGGPPFYSGDRFFDKKTIRGEKGDSIDIEFNFPIPPLNREVSVGVFKDNDFCVTH